MSKKNLLEYVYPDILNHVNSGGRITASNSGRDTIPETDIDHVTEFIRAFLIPAVEPLTTLHDKHLKTYIDYWYTVYNTRPVNVSLGAVAVAMCRAGFTAYALNNAYALKNGGGFCFNVRPEDVNEIYRVLHNAGLTPKYEA